MGEFPKFLVLSTGVESLQNSPIFTFSLLLSALVLDLPFLLSGVIEMG
jgi:hypothetical protein